MDAGATQFCAKARSAGIALGWRFQVNRMVQLLVANAGAGVTCVPWNTDGPLKMSRALAEWPDDYDFPGCLSVCPTRGHMEDLLL